MLSPEINTRHLVLYFDKDCDSLDGNGWAVEYSDGETVYRFQELQNALDFIHAFSYWFRQDKEDSERIHQS